LVLQRQCSTAEPGLYRIDRRRSEKISGSAGIFENETKGKKNDDEKTKRNVCGCGGYRLGILGVCYNDVFRWMYVLLNLCTSTIPAPGRAIPGNFNKNQTTTKKGTNKC
jgi:hypothetical protein